MKKKNIVLAIVVCAILFLSAAFLLIFAFDNSLFISLTIPKAPQTTSWTITNDWNTLYPNVTINFTSNDSFNDVKSYYISQLEKSGWKFDASSSQDVHLLGNDVEPISYEFQGGFIKFILGRRYVIVVFLTADPQQHITNSYIEIQNDVSGL